MKKNYKSIFFGRVALYTIAAAICVQAPYMSLANNNGSVVSSEQVQQKRVTLNISDMSIKHILNQIKRQTGIGYVIDKAIEERLSSLSINVENESIENTLKILLNGTRYDFTIENGIITIIKKEPVVTGFVDVAADSYIVNGVVLDDNDGEPIAGATIIVKGSDKGAISHTNGRFTLKVNEGDILEVTFLGKVTRQIVAAKTLSISLKDDVMAMDEIMINTGYAKVDPRESTSAITTLKMDDIMKPGAQTIDMMLEGHVPGLTFMQNTGQIGASPSLRIRGTSTVLGNRNPVWVLDGVIIADPVNVDPAQINDLDFVNLLGNAISGLNPEDIEQIDVLKDASATALYGDAAANGVIVITTKKGKPGPPSVTYSFTGRYTPRPRYTNSTVNVMNSKERIDFSRSMIENRLGYPSVDSWVGYEAAYRDYMNGILSHSEFSEQVSYYEALNTDWFDILMQDAYSNKHTVSLSGGTTDTRYYASVGADNSQGSAVGEKNSSYTTTLNITGNYNKLSVHFGLTGNITEKKYTPSDVGVVDFAYNTSRAVPALNDDGSYWYYNEEVTAGDDIYYLPINIIEDIDNTEQLIKQNSINLQANLGYKFTSDLTGRLTAAYSFSNSNEQVWYGEHSSYSRSLNKSHEYGDDESEYIENTLLPIGDELQMSTTDRKSYTVRAQFDYRKTLGDDMKHIITATLGGELSSNKYDTYEKHIRGYNRERGGIISGVKDVEDYKEYLDWTQENEYALGKFTYALDNKVSAFTTLGYIFNQVYYLNFNARIDYSNKFGSRANEASYPIWSVSGKWDIFNDLIKDSKIINDLNLRASYGYQGNAPSSPSQVIIQKHGTSSSHGEYYSTIDAYPNPYLSWEKTENFDVALNFGILGNKIRGEVGYYKRTTRDAFVSQTISEVNGTTSYTVNQGRIENEGFEIGLQLNIFDSAIKADGSRGFYWRFDPQLGSVINKIIDKAIDGDNAQTTNRDDETLTYKDYLNGSVQTVNKAIDGFFSYKFMGLDPVDGRPLFVMDNVTEEDFGQAFKDMSDEERYLYSMEYSGSRVPTLQGGFTNNIGYGRFALSVSCSYSFGNKIRQLKLYSGITSENGTMAPSPMENLRKEVNGRWQAPGDEAYTDIPGVLNNEEFDGTVSFGSSNERYWWLTNNYNKTANRKVIGANIWEMYDYSNARLVSGNYLKISSATLRYLVPDELCRKLGFKSAYATLSGSNLFTFASKELDGQSPTQSGSSTNIPQAVLPVYTLGINVTF